MKSYLPSIALFPSFIRLRHALLVSLLLAICASSARAQANFTFSGGNGAPLTITLNSPVLYTITTASSSNAPLFDFQSVGNIFHGSPVSLAGSIAFSINGGAAQMLNTLNSGAFTGIIRQADFLAYGPLPGVSVGNVVTLTAGSLTTTSNVAAAPPANGSYQTFITDGNGSTLEAVNGIAVPEPSSLALATLGGAGLLLMLARRLRRA
jgi:hypothetical protein